MAHPEPSEERQGWGHPTQSRKWHYFKSPMSLCGKWGFYFGPLEMENVEKKTPDDCAECRRRLDKILVTRGEE